MSLALTITNISTKSPVRDYDSTETNRIILGADQVHCNQAKRLRIDELDMVELHRTLAPVECLKIAKPGLFSGELVLNTRPSNNRGLFTDEHCERLFNFYIKRRNKQSSHPFYYSFWVASAAYEHRPSTVNKPNPPAKDEILLIKTLKDDADIPDGIMEKDYYRVLDSRPIPEGLSYPFGACLSFICSMEEPLISWGNPFVRTKNFYKSKVFKLLEQYSQTGFDLVLTNRDADHEVFRLLQNYFTDSCVSENIWQYMSNHSVMQISWWGV